MSVRSFVLVFSLWIALTSVNSYGFVNPEIRRVMGNGNVDNFPKRNFVRSGVVSSAVNEKASDKQLAKDTNTQHDALPNHNISQNALNKLKFIEQNYVGDRKLLLQHLEKQIALRKQEKLELNKVKTEKEHTYKNSTLPEKNEIFSTSLPTKPEEQTSKSLKEISNVSPVPAKPKELKTISINESNNVGPDTHNNRDKSTLREEQIIHQIDQQLQKMLIDDKNISQVTPNDKQTPTLNSKAQSLNNKVTQAASQISETIHVQAIEAAQTPKDVTKLDKTKLVVRGSSKPTVTINQVQKSARDFAPQIIDQNPKTFEPSMTVNIPYNVNNGKSNNQASLSPQNTNQGQLQVSMHQSFLPDINIAPLQQHIPQHIFMPFDSMPFYNMFKDGGIMPTDLRSLNGFGAKTENNDNGPTPSTPPTMETTIATTPAPRLKRRTTSLPANMPQTTPMSDAKLQRTFLEKAVHKQDLEIQKLELEIKALKRAENVSLPKEFELELKQAPKQNAQPTSAPSSTVQHLFDFGNKHMKFPFDLK